MGERQGDLPFRGRRSCGHQTHRFWHTLGSICLQMEQIRNRLQLENGWRGCAVSTEEKHWARSPSVGSRRILNAMCRNITTLRGLEPQATREEIEAAARQYIRKVSGVQSPSPLTEKQFERAVKKVLAATAELLEDLPPRRQPPPTLPPLRRLSKPRA